MQDLVLFSAWRVLDREVVASVPADQPDRGPESLVEHDQLGCEREEVETKQVGRLRDQAEAPKPLVIVDY